MGDDGTNKAGAMKLNCDWMQKSSGFEKAYLKTLCKSYNKWHDLPSLFQAYQNKYALLCKNDKSYKVFLKLEKMEWSYLCFDTEHTTNDRKITKNMYCLANEDKTQVANQAAKLWFEECMYSNDPKQQQIITALHKDCKEKPGMWIKILAGKYKLLSSVIDLQTQGSTSMLVQGVGDSTLCVFLIDKWTQGVWRYICGLHHV